MWKWIAAAALALVVGFALGRATNMHRGNYGHWPPCHNEFGQMHNDRGMGPQCMGGPFNGGPMPGNCRNCRPMDMRGPNPCNDMAGKYGCPNRPGDNGNRMNFMPCPPPPENDMPGRCGCCNRPGNDGDKYGRDKKDGDKKERRHGDDDNDDKGDDEDND